LELSAESGVYVLAVDPDGAAGRAGLQSPQAQGVPGALPPGGDVIVSLNGEAVGDLSELRNLLDEHEPGDTVTLGVVRGDEELEFEVTLDEWAPADPSFRVP